MCFWNKLCSSSVLHAFYRRGSWPPTIVWHVARFKREIFSENIGLNVNFTYNINVGLLFRYSHKNLMKWQKNCLKRSFSFMFQNLTQKSSLKCLNFDLLWIWSVWIEVQISFKLRSIISEEKQFKKNPTNVASINTNI